MSGTNFGPLLNPLTYCVAGAPQSFWHPRLLVPWQIVMGAWGPDSSTYGTQYVGQGRR